MMIKPTSLAKYERIIIAAFFTIIFILAFGDVYNDYFEGVAIWHLVIEIIVAIISLLAVLYLVNGLLLLRKSLSKEKQISKDLDFEALKWKKISEKYIKGLSIEIDDQLNRWGLTEAEKGIAFLLLKGLSDKEISSVRKTSVKTVRTQVNAIYSKTRITSRSEFLAFFLEDLFLPVN